MAFTRAPLAAVLTDKDGYAINLGTGTGSFTGTPESIVLTDSTGNPVTVGTGQQVLFASVGNTDTLNAPNNTTANFATKYTVPANYLTANKLLRVTLTFSITTSSSPVSFGIRMSIGGVSAYVGAGAAPTASLTNVPLAMQFLIQGSAAPGASASVYVNNLPNYQLATSNTGPFNQVSGAIAQPISLATNGTLVIQPILFASANTAGNSMTLQQFVVEALN